MRITNSVAARGNTPLYLPLQLRNTLRQHTFASKLCLLHRRPQCRQHCWYPLSSLQLAHYLLLAFRLYRFSLLSLHCHRQLTFLNIDTSCWLCPWHSAWIPSRRREHWPTAMTNGINVDKSSTVQRTKATFKRLRQAWLWPRPAFVRWKAEAFLFTFYRRSWPGMWCLNGTSFAGDRCFCQRHEQITFRLSPEFPAPAVSCWTFFPAVYCRGLKSTVVTPPFRNNSDLWHLLRSMLMNRSIKAIMERRPDWLKLCHYSWHDALWWYRLFHRRRLLSITIMAFSLIVGTSWCCHWRTARDKSRIIFIPGICAWFLRLLVVSCSANVRARQIDVATAAIDVWCGVASRQPTEIDERLLSSVRRTADGPLAVVLRRFH